MSNQKECELFCPFKYSKEIDFVCPSTGTKDQLDALDFCQQVMLGRRKEAELLKNSDKLPERDPRIVEYSLLNVEDTEADDFRQPNLIDM
jgi:hypothetical protein